MDRSLVVEGNGADEESQAQAQQTSQFLVFMTRGGGDTEANTLPAPMKLAVECGCKSNPGGYPAQPKGTQGHLTTLSQWLQCLLPCREPQTHPAVQDREGQAGSL